MRDSTGKNQNDEKLFFLLQQKLKNNRHGTEHKSIEKHDTFTWKTKIDFLQIFFCSKIPQALQEQIFENFISLFFILHLAIPFSKQQEEDILCHYSSMNFPLEKNQINTKFAGLYLKLIRFLLVLVLSDSWDRLLELYNDSRKKEKERIPDTENG